MAKFAVLHVLVAMLLLVPQLHAQSTGGNGPIGGILTILFPPSPAPAPKSPAPQQQSPQPANPDPNPNPNQNPNQNQNKNKGNNPATTVANPASNLVPTIAEVTRTVPVQTNRNPQATVPVQPLDGDLALFQVPATMTQAPLPPGVSAVLVNPSGVPEKLNANASSTSNSRSETSGGGLSTGAIVGLGLAAFGALLLLSFVGTKVAGLVRRNNDKRAAVQYALEHNKGDSLARKERGGSLTWGRKKQELSVMPAPVKQKKDRVYPDNLGHGQYQDQYGYQQSYNNRPDTYYNDQYAPQQYQHQYPPQPNYYDNSQYAPYGGPPSYK